MIEYVRFTPPPFFFYRSALFGQATTTALKPLNKTKDKVANITKQVRNKTGRFMKKVAAFSIGAKFKTAVLKSIPKARMKPINITLNAAADSYITLPESYFVTLHCPGIEKLLAFRNTTCIMPEVGDKCDPKDKVS